MSAAGACNYTFCEVFKPKTSSTPTEKKGIDAALDGLE